MINMKKYSWVPIIAIIVGLALPNILIEPPEGGFDAKTLTGIYSSMAKLNIGVRSTHRTWP